MRHRATGQVTEDRSYDGYQWDEAGLSVCANPDLNYPPIIQPNRVRCFRHHVVGTISPEAPAREPRNENKMRFASFTGPDAASFGIVEDGRLRPIVDSRFPDLNSVIAAGAYDEAAAAATEPVAIDDTPLAPVLPNPGKIICIGMNYVAHIKEMGRERPAWPTLFTRFPDSLVGHGQPIVRPAASIRYDFEGELAVVIGRKARHITADRAPDYIAGYACFLDGTLRDYQRHTSQFIAGKNFRHSGSFGPWLVTADEIPDPRVLTLETRVNGQVMQAGRIDDLRR